jgi:hypothetical protein
MRISVSALTITLGVFWGAAVAIVAVTNLIWPSYGRPFLEVVGRLGLSGLPRRAIARAGRRG